MKNDPESLRYFHNIIFSVSTFPAILFPEAFSSPQTYPAVSSFFSFSPACVPLGPFRRAGTAPTARGAVRKEYYMGISGIGAVISPEAYKARKNTDITACSVTFPSASHDFTLYTG